MFNLTTNQDMKQVNEQVKLLIIDKLGLNGRDKFIIEHVLNGGKFRDVLWNDKLLNVGTVSQTRDKHIPFIKISNEGLFIIEDKAPQWLLNSDVLGGETDTLISTQKTLDFEQMLIPISKHEQILQQSILAKQQELEEGFCIERKNIQDTIKIKNNEIVQNMISEHAKQFSDLKQLHVQELDSQKDVLKIRYTKETSELYTRQLDSINAAYLKANEDLNNVRKNELLLQQKIKENIAIIIEKDKLITELKTKQTHSLSLIETLEKRVADLLPKFDRSFYLQSFISILWLLGLMALSVFSIENMIIYFNAGSFWIVAIILGVFVEFMLWATNIAKFSGALDNNLTELDYLSKAIFFFRAFANALGGYYICINAETFKDTKNWYASIVSTFTDITDLYFGMNLGSWGIIGTAIIIGGIVAYMEYKALPLALKHAHNLFIVRK